MGSSGQSAWAWSAAVDPAFRAPLAPVWPKAIAQPMGLGFTLWPLGFGAWPWRCRLCRPLLSLPLPLAQARLGAQVPRCPGVQAQATPPWLRAADATDAPGAWRSGPRPACPGPLASPHPFPSGSALVRLPRQLRLQNVRLGPSPSGASPSRRPIWGRPKGPPLFPWPRPSRGPSPARMRLAL